MDNPFLRAYEFEKRYKLDRLRYTLDRAEESLTAGRPEALDFAKSALEMICKAILDERQVSYRTGDGKFHELPRLVKDTCTALGCQNEQLRGSVGGMAQVIAQMRNDETVAGHGLEGNQPFLNKAGIATFVTAFTTVVDMVFNLLDATPIDFLTTKQTFEAVEGQLKLATLNREIDTSAEVEYSQLDGRLYINGSEFRPSVILYGGDRVAYQQGIEAAEDRLRERMIDQIDAELSDGRFDNFHPGHYGYDTPEIWIETIQRDGGCMRAKGSISTSARLGSSREEDGMDISYDSAFTAVFVQIDDPEASLDEIQLESLVLEVNDWIEHEPDEDEA